MADSSAVQQEVDQVAVHQAVLDKMTSEREHALDRHADSKALGHSPEEKALNSYLIGDLKYLFGETGFNPPVPARNPILVTTHNPRFSAALWAINGEAYRRKGVLSRSQKEVIALGASLANNCPHCAFIHTAMGPASGDDVTMDATQCFYNTQDPDAAFPLGEGQDPVNNKFAAWAIKHRDGIVRPIPCTEEQVPEVLGTVMLFDMLNRIVDAFVSKTDSGPMFPLPVRFLLKFDSVAPIVHRAMSWMMSWMMHGEDKKVQAGKTLTGINKVSPIIKGWEGSDAPPLKLPEAMSWAAKPDPAIAATFAFLAAEAEIMAECFVSPALKTYVETWASKWDGGMVPSGASQEWLDAEVAASGFGEEDTADVVMLRLMLITVVASHKIDDTLLSECQTMVGFRGTHATVMWAAFLAAQRSSQLAFSGGVDPPVRHQ